MIGLVVIPCGAAKQSVPAPAKALYTGAYFRSCRRAAEALKPSLGWLILSAKYGLVRPDTMLNPYNLTLGQAGAVTGADLARQAQALGVAALSPVMVLAGSRYVAAARSVWPHATAPLQANVTGGMGAQMGYLAQVTRLGRLP